METGRDIEFVGQISAIHRSAIQLAVGEDTAALVGIHPRNISGGSVEVGDSLRVTGNVNPPLPRTPNFYVVAPRTIVKLVE